MTKAIFRTVTDRSDDTVSLAVAESIRDRYITGNIQPTSPIAIAMFAVVEAEDVVKAYAPSKPYPTFWCEYAFAAAWERSDR